MVFESHTLTATEAGSAIGDKWDELPARRGAQADIFCSYSWFASWLSSVSGQVAARTCVPFVVDDGDPVAVLPLVQNRWLWVTAGMKARPRSRLVLAKEQPDHDAVAALVDRIGRSNIKELSLYRMPTRDPATSALIDALRADGMDVAAHERSTDNVVRVPGNDDFARRLRKFATSTRSLERRVSPHWPITIEGYGGEAATPVAEGLELFELVQERSWKGTSKRSTQILRREFMLRADARGWVRLAILEIAGRPAAANAHFRIGGVAFGLTTAYDQQMAALSPGSILHGHVQDEIFDSSPPDVMDLLPGTSPFKDRMAPERPPLVTVEACRRTLVRGASFGPRRWLRRNAPPTWARARLALESRTHRLSKRRRQESEAESVYISPGEPGGAEVSPIEVGTALRRYLAVVAGLPSAEAVAATWDEGDEWYLVEDGGLALARVGGAVPRKVRDVVRLTNKAAAEEIARTIATALDMPLQLTLPEQPTADTPPLPWTDTLLDSLTKRSG